MKSNQRLSDLATMTDDQFNLRFQRATGQLENTSRVRVVRRDIARVRTLQVRRKASSAQA
jgi:large subunit ribosomal protein L29